MVSFVSKPRNVNTVFKQTDMSLVGTKDSFSIGLEEANLATRSSTTCTEISRNNFIFYKITGLNGFVLRKPIIVTNHFMNTFSLQQLEPTLVHKINGSLPFWLENRVVNTVFTPDYHVIRFQLPESRQTLTYQKPNSLLSLKALPNVQCQQ